MSSVRSMQATVATYDPDTRSGTVVLDDGTELSFDAAAFAAGGLRLLRFGQRVNIAVAESGRDTAESGEDVGASGGDDRSDITAITLATFPLPDPGAPDVRAAEPDDD
jgi:cold shock CspA family protein